MPEFDLRAAFPDLAPLLDRSAEAWHAEVEAQFDNGAILIVDANGDPIAWSTDAAGRVAGHKPPVRRSREDIARNAQILAAAPEMVRALRLIAAQGPCLLTILRARGIPVSNGLAAAIRSAELVAKDLPL